MSCSFTESHYRYLLQELLSEGYRFREYIGLSPGETHQVILRHDVDISLEDALRIARIESEMGITSVFHVLLTSEIYNPASNKAKEILEIIRNYGHRIGLHVDPMAIGTGNPEEASFQKGVRELFDIARLVLGKLDSYSVHRPAANGKMDALHPTRLTFPVPPYADADEYRNGILYRSDSRREWRQGCLCGQIPHFNGQVLQLNTHPIWWPQEMQSREEVLWSHLSRQVGIVDEYFAANLSFYVRYSNSDV